MINTNSNRCEINQHKDILSMYTKFQNEITKQHSQVGNINESWINSIMNKESRCKNDRH